MVQREVDAIEEAEMHDPALPNRRLMRIHLVLLALFSSTVSLKAAPTSFPEHNFSMELPAGWTDISPRPEQTLIAAHSADNSERILVSALKLRGRDRESGASEMRAGVKKGFSEQGLRIEPDREVTLN